MTDAILALHRITHEEPIDRVDDLVTRAIEKETTDYMMEWSDRIKAVLDEMDPSEVDQLRRYYAESSDPTEEGYEGDVP